jgi:hypothetical protein
MKRRSLIEALHAVDRRVRFRGWSGNVEKRSRRLADGLDFDTNNGQGRLPRSAVGVA